MKTLYVRKPTGLPSECEFIDDYLVSVSDELYERYACWRDIEYRVDGHASGVLADWIEDHPEHIVGEEETIRLLLTHLRYRFAHPDFNTVTPPARQPGSPRRQRR